jgi:hypothetical protein
MHVLCDFTRFKNGSSNSSSFMYTGRTAQWSVSYTATFPVIGPIQDSMVRFTASNNAPDDARMFAICSRSVSGGMDKYDKFFFFFFFFTDCTFICLSY